jgi:hypothetical protein
LKATGENLKWYSDAKLNQLEATGELFTQAYPIHGIYNYWVTQTRNGNTSSPKVTKITLYQLPSVSLGSDTTVNESIILDAGSGFVSYLWSTGELRQTINVNGYPNYDPREIFVKVIDKNDCTITDTITVKFSKDSIMDLSGECLVKIYPNPVSNVLHLEVHNIESEIRIQVLSMNGTILMNKKFKSAPNVIQNIDISSLAIGTYVLKVIGNSIIRTEKIIIN